MTLIIRIKNNLDKKLLNKIDKNLLKEHLFLPIKIKDNFLYIAVCKSSNKTTIRNVLKKTFSHSIKFILVSNNDLKILLTDILPKNTEIKIPDSNSDNQSQNSNKNIIEIDKKDKLGEILLKKGLISNDDLIKGLEEAKNKRINIGSTLFQMGLISLEQLKEALHEQTGYDVVTTAQLSNPNLNDYIKFLEPEFIIYHRVIPIYTDDRNIIIGVVKPLSQNIVKLIIYKTGLIPKQLLITRFEFDNIINNNTFFAEFNARRENQIYEIWEVSRNSYFKYTNKIKQCIHCQKKYYNLQYKFCPECGSSLFFSYENITEDRVYTDYPCYVHCHDEELPPNTTQVCPCCHDEQKEDFILRRMELWVEGYLFHYYFCNNCLTVCNNCGNYILSEKLQDFIEKETEGKKYTINTLFSDEACSCDSPKPSDYYLFWALYNKRLPRIPQVKNSLKNSDILLSEVLATKQKYCYKCQIVLPTEHKYCPYCDKRTSDTKDIPSELFSSPLTETQECTLCHNTATTKIKLIGDEKIEQAFEQAFCSCEIYLCDHCIKRCETCGKIILTPPIEELLKNKGNNCNKNKCKTCISLAFCNCRLEKPVIDSQKQQVQSQTDESIITTFKEAIPEIKAMPIYQKIFSLFLAFQNLFAIVVILIGIICTIWLLATGGFIKNLSIFLVNMIIGLIIGYILNLIYLLPIIISKNLFKIKYAKWLGQILLFSCTIMQSFIISLYCYSVYLMVIDQNLNPILTILLTYFYSSAFGVLLFGIYNNVLVACFFIVSLLGYIFNLNIITTFGLLFLMMILPLFCINYSLTEQIANEEQKDKNTPQYPYEL